MGIPNNYTPVEITPFAGQTEFPFPFYLDSVDDFYFFIDGDDTERLLGNYTIAPQYIDNENGGIVVLTNAPYTSGTAPVVKLLRKSVIERLAQFILNQPVTPAMLNSEFNNIILILQEHAHILDSLDAEAITAKVIEVAQEAAGAVVGEANLTIGDSLVTARDLDSNELYLREKVPFDRASYPDFEALLGEYIPDDYDFNDAQPSDRLYDPYGNLNTNQNHILKYDVWGDETYQIRQGELVIVNKIDMSIITIHTPPTDYIFVSGIVVGSDLIVLSVSTIAPLNIKISKLETFNGTLTEELLIPLNLKTSNLDNYGMIYDKNNNNLYVTISEHFSKDIPQPSLKILNIIKLNNDLTEWTSTQLQITTALVNGTVFNDTRSGFFNTNINKLQFLYSAGYTAALDYTPQSLLYTIDDSFLNQSSGTIISKYMVESQISKFNDISLSLLDKDAYTVWYTNTADNMCKYNKDTNTLTVTPNTPYTIYDNAGQILNSDEFIVQVCYDLYDNSVKSILKVKDIKEFLGDYTVLPQFQISKYWMNCLDEKTIMVGNKLCVPYIAITTNSPQEKYILFLNYNNSKTEIIASYEIETGLNSGGGNYATANMDVIVDNLRLFWMQGNSFTNNETRKIKQLEILVDEVKYNTRPAPELNAVLPSKGYWKGRDI